MRLLQPLADIAAILKLKVMQGIFAIVLAIQYNGDKSFVPVIWPIILRRSQKSCMSEQNPPQSPSLDQFLHPHHSYEGKTTPENLVFNANLQEFGQKISYLCSLETNGKISSEEAYQKIRQLWKKIKESKQELFGLKDEE
ncbi:MAG: hypothetical protein VKJ02_10530 [Snowella sp.]|nr:hypothetical protein [Snowella sp.]